MTFRVEQCAKTTPACMTSVPSEKANAEFACELSLDPHVGCIGGQFLVS